MKKLFILLFAPLLFIACSTDDEGVVEVPELVITSIDCPVEDIVMTAEVKVTGGTGRWFVNVSVKITCAGEPVNGAEIMVKYGWVTLPTKIKTNEEGNAKGKRKVTTSAKPSGKVKVTIKGSDDSKTETVTF